MPSRNSALPSTGVAKVFPRILAAITGVPVGHRKEREELGNKKQIHWHLVPLPQNTQSL